MAFICVQPVGLLRGVQYRTFWQLVFCESPELFFVFYALHVQLVQLYVQLFCEQYVLGEPFFWYGGQSLCELYALYESPACCDEQPLCV